MDREYECLSITSIQQQVCHYVTLSLTNAPITGNFGRDQKLRKAHDIAAR